MGTSTFGNNPARNNFFFSDGALDNQAWNAAQTINDVGRVVQLDAFFSGDTAGCTGGPVLWDGSGNVLLYTALSCPISTGTVNTPNNQQYEESTGFDYAFASGASFMVGAFRNSSQTWVFGFENSGLNCLVKTVSGTSPGAATSGTTLLSASGSSNGIMDAYATYFVGTTYVKRGGVWTKAAGFVKRAGSWGSGSSRPKIYVKRSGTWQQVNIQAKNQELDWKVEQPALVVHPDGSWENGIFRWIYDEVKRFGSNGLASRLATA